MLGLPEEFTPDFLARLEQSADQDAARVRGSRQGRSSVAAARLVAGVQRLPSLCARRRFPLHRLGPLRPHRQALHQAVQGRGGPPHLYLPRRQRLDGLSRGRPQVSDGGRDRAGARLRRAGRGRPRDGARAGGRGQSRRRRPSSTDAIGSSSWRSLGRDQARPASSISRRRSRASWSRCAAPARSS